MIAVDWGSSSLRAYRLDAQGEIIERRPAPLGVLTCAGRFDDVLREQIDGWDDTLVVLCGMIGSRQGWAEVPYVRCPATAADVAGSMERIDSPALPGRSVWIVPGVLYRSTAADGLDVMRGEETQLFGLMKRLDAGRHLVCMPGTHSKWAFVRGGCIEAFFTAMTGEVFDLLRKHSLLGRLMPEGDSALDKSAVIRGVARARLPGGLLNHLFSVRTSGLTETLAPEQLASYLSGILIASELLDSPWADQVRCQAVHLIGDSTVLEPYSIVMQELGITVQCHDEAFVAAGIHLLAMSRALPAAGADPSTSMNLRP